MKLIKKIISKIPFATYSMKVDPYVRSILAIKKTKQIPLIVVFRMEPDSILLSRLKRLGFKVKHTIPFAKAVCGKLPTRSFESLSNILEIEKIYYDGKAILMGTKDKRDKKVISPLKLSNSMHLSGKDICVAFIDSGVYPHPDFTKPRNRIAAFKDFIHHLDFPYDDNGHGTACIGAAFGASIDGRFKGTAYDSSIVCAKAFDEFSSGFYSDILAAMQWILDIREQYNIKIVVLPFGTTNYSRNFDLLSTASQKLWNSGLFVCTCTGNMGPHESSITSPGLNTSSLTVGACSVEELPPKIVNFSGRGPVFAKADKPDVVMPGCNITTLNADTTYHPRNKIYYDHNKHGVLYREYSGTSISASLAAAAAALVYQINALLSPDDVKSVLKTCCTSINELKTAQGVGMINIKKLEEL